MAFVEAGDLRIRYELSGPKRAPMVVLSHSLGADVSMWDPQLAPLERRLRVLRYDTRGHGQSSLAPGPYALAALAGDVLRLLDAQDVARAHFCGLSMGGMIGMWLGAHAASRLDRLVLCNTGARIGSAGTWNARIQAVSEGGITSIASAVIERWFTAEFRAASPEAVAGIRNRLESTPPQGYSDACAALRDADERADLAAIRAPTLVIAGSRDPATPPADGRAIASAIRGARYLELAAAHLSNIEAAEDFTAALVGFLTAEPGL